MNRRRTCFRPGGPDGDACGTTIDSSGGRDAKRRARPPPDPDGCEDRAFRSPGLGGLLRGAGRLGAGQYQRPITDDRSRAARVESGSRNARVGQPARDDASTGGGAGPVHHLVAGRQWRGPGPWRLDSDPVRHDAAHARAPIMIADDQFHPPRDRARLRPQRPRRAGRPRIRSSSVSPFSSPFSSWRRSSAASTPRRSSPTCETDHEQRRIEEASAPLRQFMLKQTRRSETGFLSRHLGRRSDQDRGSADARRGPGLCRE